MTELALGDGSIMPTRNLRFKTVKVSVDDNTLDLTQGSLDDKFDNGNQEIRTSAFAVAMDDSPLYRRFNNAALGENANDGR